MAQSGSIREAPASPVFRSRTDLVALDVSVQHQAGQAVPVLTADEFLVLEDNIPQKLTVFSAGGRLPLAVILLIDQSQSMDGERLDRAKAAAAALLHILGPDDLVEILAFNDDTIRLYPLGSDHSAAERATTGLTPGGATALYDALLVGLRDLQQALRGRTDYQKAIVILSDGEDTASREMFEDVLEDARRTDVAIDAVSLRTDKRDHSLPPVHELTQLATDTGGRAVAVHRLADLVPVYEDIGAELRHQYRLGYVSSSTINDGRWRRISVRIANRDVVARTRAGYYAN
jgi:Ca-activated chloride channel homolog